MERDVGTVAAEGGYGVYRSRYYIISSEIPPQIRQAKAQNTDFLNCMNYTKQRFSDRVQDHAAFRKNQGA